MTEWLKRKNVFAQNCLVLTSSPSDTRQNCLQVHTADTNRRKQKANQEPSVPINCNKRFMTKEEVEYQLKREKVAKRNAEKRTVYWERNLKMVLAG